MDAHVVCINDSVEFVVLGDKTRAEQKMLELKEEYFVRNQGAFATREDYKRRCRWHISTVSCEDTRSKQCQSI